MSFNWKASGLFAAGVAFGTAGIKILSSKDAKRAYTQCTAAALRAKDCVMKTVNTVQENAEDILAEAKSINEGAARLRLRLLRFRMHLRMYASVLRLMSRKQSRLRLQQRLLRHRR